MLNKATEYSVQTLENLSSDQTVSPPILRRGILGKNSDGNYYDIGVNSDGSLAAGLGIPSYDYVAVTYPTTTTEQYVFKTGGSTGTTVATVNLTYTDSTKKSLSSAEKV